MGRYVFRLPDVGEGVAEAEIAMWHVRPGDVVKEDQSLVDVMTDKATLDMTSPVDGTVVAVHGDAGAMLPVGAVLIEFEVDGLDVADRGVGGAGSASFPTSAPPAPPKSAPVEIRPDPPVAVAPGVRAPAEAGGPQAGRPAFAARAAGAEPLAAPATRRRAFDLGIPLQFVPGTGPAGRVTPDDLDAYVAARGASPAAPRPAARDGIEEVRIIGMRRRIADKVQESKRRIPHIAYVEECDLTELESLRADLNAHRRSDWPKLTLLPFFMRALARALEDFPQFNALYDDEAGVLRVHEGVHVGIATQTRSGLVVPVVRHVEARDLWDCAGEVARVAKTARDGSAKRGELSGSTITITSLGALGGIATTPVINHPEVAIIGPNKLVDRPIVQGSFVTVRKMMNLSSSFDHRIIDGHDAALFVQTLKRIFEHPALMFMDRLS